MLERLLANTAPEAWERRAAPNSARAPSAGDKERWWRFSQHLHCHMELTLLIAKKLRAFSSVVHYMFSMDECIICTVSVLKIHTQKRSVIYCVTAAVVCQRVAPPQGSW